MRPVFGVSFDELIFLCGRPPFSFVFVDRGICSVVVLVFGVLDIVLLACFVLVDDDDGIVS